MNKPSIQSVANAFAILEHVLECSMISEGVGLAEIAERFGMQKTTARNMMQTLEFCGYIRRSARGIYAAGEKCAMLSKAGSFAERIRPAAVRFLKEAAEQTGESFILTTIFNGERMIIASVSGNSVISVNPELIESERRFNYLRVTTRVLLAFAPDYEREMFLAANPVDKKAWPELETGFGAVLAGIRRKGLCVKAEKECGYYAVARPVFSAKGTFLGALGGYIPIIRAEQRKIETLHLALNHIADQLTNQTGDVLS